MEVKAKILTPMLDQMIADGDIEVPMLPEVANKAVTLAQNPDSNANEMANLISADQSLAAHVMRIANSAAYTPNASLTSLQQAIARLGMALISEIAVAASIGTKMFNTPGYEDHIGNIWCHALSSALWAKEIARKIRSNVETSFLSGLLHSVGRPVVVQASLDLAMKRGITLSPEEVFYVEDMYYQKIGVAVVENWGMPQVIQEVISYFEEPECAPNASDQTAIIKAAALFAHNMLDPERVTKADLIDHPVLGSLNLYPDEIEELLEKSDVVKSSMETMSK